jgi:hypothetical protein
MDVAQRLIALGDPDATPSAPSAQIGHILQAAMVVFGKIFRFRLALHLLRPPFGRAPAIQTAETRNSREE